MRKLNSALMILALVAAGLYGCTDDRAALPWDEEGEVTETECIGCHGDKDLLMELLPEEEVRYVDNRGDG